MPAVEQHWPLRRATLQLTKQVEASGVVRDAAFDALHVGHETELAALDLVLEAVELAQRLRGASLSCSL